MKHIPGERPVRAFVGDALEIPIEKIDLIGGNGKWRQLKAEEEFKQRKLEAEEQRREAKERAAEKQRKQADLAERKRRHQEEEERRWKVECEQKQQAQQEEEREKKEREAKVRQEREEKEEQRRRRMPKTCEVCDGSGKCQECMGKGYTFSVFLVSKKGYDGAGSHSTAMDHGRVLQGCDKCGGCSHNLLGDLKNGTGQCPVCQGLGKIWPIIDEPEAQTFSGASPKSRATLTVYQAERTAEVILAK
jgi:hypothetical protein